jgi:hypothetical protein
MRIIFTCAGEQKRWGNYMNQPKHLAPITDSTLLKRNIDLFDKFFTKASIYVLIRSAELKPTYDVTQKISFYTPEDIKDDEAMYKTLTPFLQMEKDDVLVLLGDVIFSEECVKNIHDNVVNKEFNVYGRKYDSTITGGKWGELFAFYVPQDFKQTFISAVTAVERLHADDKLDRFSGWEVISYIYAEGKQDDMAHIFNDRLFPASFIEIDDTTEDLDYPEDYDTYLKLLPQFSPKTL